MRFAAGYVVAQWQTVAHKWWVAWYMARLMRSYRRGGVWSGDFKKPRSRREWLRRMVRHDVSKFRWSEARGFASTIFELRRTTYGSDAYRALLARIEPSLRLHYARNDHHPEFWAGEARRMADDLGEPVEPWRMMPRIARMEMLCDWAAACRRHDDGDLRRSIVVNQRRFGFDEDERRLLGRWASRLGL